MWQMITENTKVDLNSQIEIKDLIRSAQLTRDWDAGWARYWEMTIDLSIRIGMALHTKMIVQLIKQQWDPFKLNYCT